MKKIGLFALVLSVGFLIAQVPFPGGAGGGGAGGGGFTQLTKTLLGSPAANFTFSSISGNYNSLDIKCQGASSTAAGQDVVVMQANGDTATNYNTQQINSAGATVTGAVQLATATPSVAAIAASTAPANSAGGFDIYIPNYAGTTFQKDAIINTAWKQADSSGNINVGAFYWNWKSTAAITQILLKLSSGANFVTGSVCTLYGIQ